MSPAPYPRRWLALVVLSLSLLVISIDNTILNVALPTMRDDLGADSSQQQWIVDGYLLVFAGLLLAAGTLGDRFGRRRTLFGGLVVFALGSLLAAFSDGATALIGCRALMGVGAAAIMPTTLSILTNIFPRDERPKAIAVWAAVSGMGIALGPMTGGFLLEHFDWTSVFLVNLPIVAICLVAGAILIPESKDPAPKGIDLPGCGLSVIGLTAVVWALIEAPHRGWTDPGTLVAIAGGLAAFGAFVAWERRTDHPLLDVAVFRNKRFTAASLAIAFVFFALMGIAFFMTTYLQTVMGFSALQTGVRMVPLALGMIVASRLSVPLSARLGAKLPVAGGLVVVASALGLLSTATTGSGYGLVALTLGMIGVGMGLAMTPATDAIMGALPKARAGVGSAMNDVVREVGGTLGVAVLGSILASNYGGGMKDAVTGLSGEASEAARDSVGAAHAVAGSLDADSGTALVGAADGAFIEAMTAT
ncbi:MAG TPA: MFS transporter, partial [Solirubrobacteraceae bacterium]|nr:MFS transporter [Solirubrobacteraceae bacterium]